MTHLDSCAVDAVSARAFATQRLLRRERLGTRLTVKVDLNRLQIGLAAVDQRRLADFAGRSQLAPVLGIGFCDSCKTTSESFRAVPNPSRRLSRNVRRAG